MKNHYHYIITGAGLAGSSILMRLLKDPYFANKKILVIDESAKTQNDRTWCFWETGNGLFEPVVKHSWDQLLFQSPTYTNTFSIKPYRYKMIRGIDFYDHIREEAKKNNNIEWRNSKVKSIGNKDNYAIVETEASFFTCDYVFNSILFTNNHLFDNANTIGTYHLLQHFKGWMVETAEAVFDPTVAGFMDFSISQDEGTAFMYVLPTSTRSALVEYTLFTKSLLTDEAYNKTLQNYLKGNLALKEYTISHEEFGVIPMTNHLFPIQDGRIIYIGVAGGQVKGSSGYTFSFIQKRADQVIAALKEDGFIQLKRSFNEKKFRLYDSVLLNILSANKLKGGDIFTDIFKKNPVQKVLKFLDNETTLLEDLAIMSSVPTHVFFPAACKELFRSF